MKKSIILLICLLVFISGISTYGFILYNTDNTDYSVYENPEIVKEFRGHIFFEDNFYTSLLPDIQIENLCYTELAKLPIEIREQFIKQGWKLYISSEKLDKYQNDFDFPLNGLTLYDEKIIIAQSPSVILHEFGHYYQNLIGYLDKFSEYYERDKETMASVSTYAAQNSNEYFATMFDCYIMNMSGRNSYITNAIKDSVTETWEFFDNRKENGWV